MTGGGGIHATDVVNAAMLDRIKATSSAAEQGGASPYRSGARQPSAFRAARSARSRASPV